MNYYNEWDKVAAAWLRELIKAGLIPNGYVDERSITEVTPSDLEGFTQCHFFAGIGGWSYALQLAGISATQPLWTGSPPCQPFSLAGKQLGKDDPRHLAPAFLELVAQCRPAILFGEQVAAAIGKNWLDALLIELEEQGYACGAVVLPAASVGAPHKRDRLFFGANLLADTGLHVASGEIETANNVRQEANRSANQPSGCGIPCGSMADTNNTRPQGRRGMPERADQQSAGAAGVAGSMAQSDSEQQRPNAESRKRNEHAAGERDKDTTTSSGFCGDNPTDSYHSFWSDADWLGCRDGKFRPVRSGSFPLVNAIPRGVGYSGDIILPSAEARVMRLRGYGNAIVPGVAAEFIKAFGIPVDNLEVSEIKRKPILKWAGGKMSVIDKLLQLLPRGDRLIEPFVGAGSVFLNAGFNRNLLGDANGDLVNMWQCMAEDADQVIELASDLFCWQAREDYLLVRKSFNDKSPLRMLRAAEFIYMNKVGFNGLCRYNSKGEFNAPYGDGKQKSVPKAEIRAFAEMAGSCEFRHSGFKALMSEAGAGDVVYCDPPYYAVGDEVMFTKYSANAFTFDDQRALVGAAVAAAGRGARVAISNSGSPVIREMYEAAGMTIHELPARRSISCARDTRGNAPDILAVL